MGERDWAEHLGRAVNLLLLDACVEEVAAPFILSFQVPSQLRAEDVSHSELGTCLQG